MQQAMHMLRVITTDTDVREIKLIDVSNLYSERPLPINEETFELALAIRQNKHLIDALPPITVVQKLTGMFQIKDGRHRFLAFRLNGIKKIKARVSKERNREK